jgi:hypothetical protein
MAKTETTVEFHAYLMSGSLRITAASVAAIKTELAAAGLPADILAQLQYGPTANDVVSDAPSAEAPVEEPAPAAEPESAPAPEPEPEPQFTETDVRKRIEKLVSLGAEGAKFAVTLMTELEAFNEDKRPNVSALAPEKYGIAIGKSEAKIAEIEAAKATAGGVL